MQEWANFMLFSVTMAFLLLSQYIQEQFIQLHPEGGALIPFFLHPL